ncbi:GerAB/ArcD/ProY family transporter [Clostridium lacusfryxellense]|uniref:GerAB/ArcD/ProY family transporter n=1 Tax=Clostridium lacusfryxellense TaxID=205328 RepID=UPI001C0AF05F|nr:GerAB/ArcD/ProY family transporter [Clostridium lacusfryxellense]MBU3113878.1 spore germination protein [Clostridium lacusfryxellense]
MDSKQNQITPGQLIEFIVSIQIGVGALTMPADLARTCGHDGWISILIYGTTITAVISIIIKLMNRYNNKSIYEINKLLYGKYLAGFLNLLIVLYLWYSTCLILRSYTNVVHVHLLRSTPSLVLCIFIIIPTYYLSWYGIKYVARFSLSIYLSISFACILFFLVFKDLRFSFLMPIGQGGIKCIKDSFSPCVFAFLGYEVISIIYPEITNKKKAMKYAISANLITTIFCILLVLVVTSFFGEEFLKKSLYPTFTLARSYRAPIIERMDILFIAMWIPVMAMTTRGYFCVTYYSINKLLNLKKKGIYLFMFTAITIFLSNIPKSLSQIDKYSKVMLVSGTAFSIFLVVCYLFSFIRKRGVKPFV